MSPERLLQALDHVGAVFEDEPAGIGVGDERGTRGYAELPSEVCGDDDPALLIDLDGALCHQ